MKVSVFLSTNSGAKTREIILYLENTSLTFFCPAVWSIGYPFWQASQIYLATINSEWKSSRCNWIQGNLRGMFHLDPRTLVILHVFIWKPLFTSHIPQLFDLGSENTSGLRQLWKIWTTTIAYGLAKMSRYPWHQMRSHQGNHRFICHLQMGPCLTERTFLTHFLMFELDGFGHTGFTAQCNGLSVLIGLNSSHFRDPCRLFWAWLLVVFLITLPGGSHSLFFYGQMRNLLFANRWLMVIDRALYGPPIWKELD